MESNRAATAPQAQFEGCLSSGRGESPQSPRLCPAEAVGCPQPRSRCWALTGPDIPGGRRLPVLSTLLPVSPAHLLEVRALSSPFRAPFAAGLSPGWPGSAYAWPGQTHLANETTLINSGRVKVASLPKPSLPPLPCARLPSSVPGGTSGAPHPRDEPESPRPRPPVSCCSQAAKPQEGTAKGSLSPAQTQPAAPASPPSAPLLSFSKGSMLSSLPA